MAENIKIGHLSVETPFANAGGVVKDVNEVEKMAKTASGWIEAGSYTLAKRIGYGAVQDEVYFHDEITGVTWNCLGLPNQGMDNVEKEIPIMAEIAHKVGKPLVINVAPVSKNPIPESLELVTRAYQAGADAVLLNAGCPNIPSDDNESSELLSHNPLALLDVLLALRQATDKYKAIFLRISPYKNNQQLKDIAAVIKTANVVSAVFTPNTWPLSQPLSYLNRFEAAQGYGGLSGPITLERSWRQAARLAMLLPEVNIVMSGGITKGSELKKRIGGSVLPNIVAASGTTFFYQSEDWSYDVDQLLSEFIDG